MNAPNPSGWRPALNQGGEPAVDYPTASGDRATDPAFDFNPDGQRHEQLIAVDQLASALELAGSGQQR